MPRDAHFRIPIPPRVNPALDRSRDLSWVRTHSLVRTPEGERRYLASRVADLAAYFYPDATGDDLGLGFDVMAWFFLFDDQFDVPAGVYPGAAVTATGQLADVLARPPGAAGPPSAPPLVTAFADLWHRMGRGMSPAWRRRAAHAWADYLAGHPTEVTDRFHGPTPEPDDHIRLRRKTIGVRPSLDLAERIGHFETPERAWPATHLEAMRLAVVDHAILVNEVFSLERDTARGDANLITSLVHHRGYSLRQSLAETVRRADRTLERFLQLESGLPKFCDALDLTVTERADVHRYGDAMRSLIRGDHDWHRAAGRYTTEGPPPDLNLEDLVTPARPPR
ncbi:terpene synthase family protein [Streptomyces sp. NPDC001985]|uniref:terpene synthase family protein n=1 Tax=Streptomyces sp. NPDC001985 TaxID=3154406 RepID=UPI00331E4103